MKVNFSFDLTLARDSKGMDIVGRWHCQMTAEMEFADRPRVGESWEFEGIDGKNWLNDPWEIKDSDIYVHQTSSGTRYVNVILDEVMREEADESPASFIATLQEKYPAWKFNENY